jgi:hypothetical protein
VLVGSERPRRLICRVLTPRPIILGGLPVSIHVEATKRAVGRYQRLGFRHIDSNEICDLMTCDRTSAPTVLPYFSSRPLIRLEHLLPQPNRLRRHFHEFVVVDEFDRLFEAEEPRWHQPDRFVCR